MSPLFHIQLCGKQLCLRILADQPLIDIARFVGENVTIGCDNYLCAEPDLDVQMLLGGVSLTEMPLVCHASWRLIL